MTSSSKDEVRDRRAAVVDAATRRLGRALTTAELEGLDRITSVMMLEALAQNIPESSVERVEALLNEPQIPDAAIGCSQCGKVLASWNPAADTFEPGVDSLVAAGAIAVPNFGWFCGQTCGDEFARVRGTQFARDASGRISYD